MKKILIIFVLLVLIFNMGMIVSAEKNQDKKIYTVEGSQRIYIYKDEQKNISSIKNDIESKAYFEIEGYIDVDYWLDRIPGTNTYLLYATITSDKFLTNYIKGSFSVKDTSILFPETYMREKSISKAYPATKIHTQYIGSFSVPNGVEKIIIIQKNLKIYNLTKASWVLFGNWSGTFYLPEN